MAYKSPGFIRKFQASIRRHFGKEVHLAQYVISDGTTIDVDDESKEAKLVDAEGNLGDAPQDGTYAVADSSDLLVIYGGAWVRTTTSNAAAGVELALQKLVADGGDRAAIEQTILDGTGLTADEWTTWMDGSYGCVELAKIETIAAAVGMEASELQALAEMDGCTFESAGSDASMAEVKADAFKQASLRNASIQFSLYQKTFTLKAAAEAVTDNAGKVEAGAIVMEDGMIAYISHYDGTIYMVDLDNLWCDDYLPVGEYLLPDGRKVTVMEVTEVYDEGTEYEWSYTYNVVDWANSELEAADVLPWVKDQVGSTAVPSANPDAIAAEAVAQHQAELSAVKLAADAHKNELVQVQTKLNQAEAEVKRLNADIAKLNATVSQRDAQIAKLNLLPGAEATPPKSNTSSQSPFQRNMEQALQHVRSLKNQ